jgi:hypothetical protein
LTSDQRYRQKSSLGKTVSFSVHGATNWIFPVKPADRLAPAGIQSTDRTGGDAQENQRRAWRAPGNEEGVMISKIEKERDAKVLPHRIRIFFRFETARDNSTTQLFVSRPIDLRQAVYQLVGAFTCPTRNHPKKPWDADEDDVIYKFVREMGLKWTLLAQSPPRRTQNAIKDRWYAVIQKKEQTILGEMTIMMDIRERLGSGDAVPEICQGSSI